MQKLEKKMRSQWTIKKTKDWWLGWPLLFKMYAWPKFHGSSPYNFWENDLNEKLHKNLPNQWTLKNRSRLNIDGSFELRSPRCTHDWSFMASPYSFWKNDLYAKTQQEFTQWVWQTRVWHWYQKRNTYVSLLLCRSDKNKACRHIG